MECTLDCQYRNTFCEKWVRVRQNRPLGSEKCAPMLIKACQAKGLIELHGMSNLRQRTFVFATRIKIFQQVVQVETRAAAKMGEIMSRTKYTSFALPTHMTFRNKLSLHFE